MPKGFLTCVVKGMISVKRKTSMDNVADLFCLLI